MSHDAPQAPAHCAEAAVAWMAPERPVSKPLPESVLARIERAGPAALDDRELLALLGIDVDDPTLAATGGSGGSSTTRTTGFAPSSFPARTAPASMRCMKSTPAA